MLLLLTGFFDRLPAAYFAHHELRSAFWTVPLLALLLICSASALSRNAQAQKLALNVSSMEEYSSETSHLQFNLHLAKRTDSNEFLVLENGSSLSSKITRCPSSPSVRDEIWIPCRNNVEGSLFTALGLGMTAGGGFVLISGFQSLPNSGGNGASGAEALVQPLSWLLVAAGAALTLSGLYIGVSGLHCLLEENNQSAGLGKSPLPSQPALRLNFRF